MLQSQNEQRSILQLQNWTMFFGFSYRELNMNEMNPLEARMNWDFDCFLCSFCRLEWLTIISWSLGDLFMKKLRHPIFISEFWGFRVQGRLWQNKIPMTCSEPLDHCSLNKHLELQGGWKGETRSQLKWQNGEQANVACHFFKTAYRCFEYGPMTANYISKQEVRIGNCSLYLF